MAYSQSVKDLSDKAKRYLLAFKGRGVQVVIGITCSHPKAKCLSTYVWRLCVSREGEKICYKAWKEMEERIVGGGNISSGHYAIKLKDFAPAEASPLEYPDAELESEIVLQYRDLAGCYQMAMEDEGGQISEGG